MEPSLHRFLTYLLIVLIALICIVAIIMIWDVIMNSLFFKLLVTLLALAFVAGLLWVIKHDFNEDTRLKDEKPIE